ncbi:MAG TPA: SurA N-terminal domain-containing protein [Terriglobia bacterium]|nr:SurA N-terminal domain-containing protein [Terriglobia bacterium]
MLLSAVMLLTPALARAETLDRVVAAVGAKAITASDVAAEYRLELLLDGKSPAAARPDAATLNQVRDRLIDRLLLEHEVELDGIKVSPDDSAVDQRLEEVRKKFSSPAAYGAGLQALGLSEDGLRRILAAQEQILRLIDERWRPLATVEAAEVESYYRDTLVPDLARQGGQQAPPLAEVESRIREILVQKKIDALLDEWLKQARTERGARVFGSAGVEAAS